MTVRHLDKKPTGAALRAARIAAGHTKVTDFAKLVGLEPPTVYRIENGVSLPASDSLVRWADACGVSLDALVAASVAASDAPSADADAAPPLSTDREVA